MLKIIVVDDEKFTREGIVTYISKDEEIEVIGCATNGLEAYEMCKEKRPDVVLMDLGMPEYDGIEGTRMIKTDFPEIKVIILTVFCETGKIKRALDNGANGYVLKDIEPDELNRIIKSSVFGSRMIHPNVFNSVIEKADEGKSQHKDDICIAKKLRGNMDEKGKGVKLTEREISILKLIVLGKSNREIAVALYISEGRVKNIISNILEKYNFKDRTQLAIFAVKNKIV